MPVIVETFTPAKKPDTGRVAKRSAFTVDANGVMHYAESNDNPTVLPYFDAIRKRLAELAG